MNSLYFTGSNPVLTTKQSMKTLVIHPDDKTTHFLSAAYADKKDWTLMTNNKCPKSLLKSLLKSHDKVVMLGHGSALGLFGDGCMLVDAKLVYLLRDKLCVGVWCHANDFFSKYHLKGYATGMVVSDTDEADYYNLNYTTSDVTHSNNLLANSLKLALESDDNVRGLLLEHYTGDTDVILFNKSNL